MKRSNNIDTDTLSEMLATAAAWDRAQAARSAGGKKAAQNMTEKERRKRAIKAAKARWKNENR